MTSMFEQQLDLQNLSDDDKAWLRSWNRHDLIEAAEAGEGPAHEDGQGGQEGDEPNTGTNPATNGQENPQDGQEGQGEPNGDAPSGEGDDEDADDNYSDWSNDDLQAELAERGLPKSGNKAELIARLEADDQD